MPRLAMVHVVLTRPGTSVLALLWILGLAMTGCKGVEPAPEEQGQGAHLDPAAQGGTWPQGPWPGGGDPGASSGARAGAGAGAGPGAGPSAGAGEPRDIQLSDLSGKDPLEGRPDTQHGFSHDGKWLFFLRPSAADAEVLDLWRQALPAGRPELLASAESLLAQGRAELTEAQRAERERKRVRHRGITSFVLDRAGKTVIVPFSGYVYRLDLRTGRAIRIFARAGGELDPRPSPDGARISFVRRGDLFVRDIQTGAERPITRGGSETLGHGVAEFVAQEELDRHEGHWWSPDGAYLALTQVDESKVALVERHQISAQGVKVVPQRYPAAGTPNARVRLGVASLATGLVRWISFQGLEDGYLARVDFAASPGPGKPPRLFVQRLSRDQRSLTLDLVDPVTLGVTRVLEERAPDYVSLHSDLRVLSEKPAVIWTSEVSGLRQLYLVDLPVKGTPPVILRHAERASRKEAPGAAAGTTALAAPRPTLAAPRPTLAPARVTSPQDAGLAPIALPRALSQLTEPLARVEGVDEKGGWVYATVHANRGREQHLYRFALAGSRLPQRLTREPGWHEITMGRQATHYVDRWSDLHQPPHATLRDAGSALIGTLDAGPRDPLSRFRQAVTRFVTIRAGDGTPLNGLLFTPPGRTPPPTSGPGKDLQPPDGLPAVIYVYGGPQGQTVARRWYRTMPWHHFIAQRGYAVLLVDGRGSAARGKAFETKLWRRFGVTDVEDVAAAARWLGAQPGIDRRRLGLWGWSYGGYLTVMTLLRTGGLFRAGVAVAPVGDWRLYDTAYTERYLGLPGPDEAVYRRSDPVPLASRLQARLLVLHGMADDNVLLTHTLRLASALQQAERPFDMMLYPGKAHSIQGTKTRRHLLGTLLDFFDRNLRREDLPPGLEADQTTPTAGPSRPR